MWFSELLPTYPLSQLKEGGKETKDTESTHDNLTQHWTEGIEPFTSDSYDPLHLEMWRRKRDGGGFSLGSSLRGGTGQGTLCCIHRKGLTLERAVPYTGDVWFFKLMTNVILNLFRRSVTHRKPWIPTMWPALTWVPQSKCSCKQGDQARNRTAEAAAVSCYLHSHLWDFNACCSD